MRGLVVAYSATFVPVYNEVGVFNVLLLLQDMMRAGFNVYSLFLGQDVHDGAYVVCVAGVYCLA